MQLNSHNNASHVLGSPKFCVFESKAGLMIYDICAIHVCDILVHMIFYSAVWYMLCTVHDVGRKHAH